MLPDLQEWEADPPEGAPKLLVVSAGTVEANKEMGLRSPVVLDQQFAAGRAFGAVGFVPLAELPSKLCTNPKLWINLAGYLTNLIEPSVCPLLEGKGLYSPNCREGVFPETRIQTPVYGGIHGANLSGFPLFHTVEPILDVVVLNRYTRKASCSKQ